MKKRKINNNSRFIELEEHTIELFKSFKFESLTEIKEIISEEITKKAKALNIFSHFGGKYKTLVDINPQDNEIQIEIKTVNNKWKLAKFNFYIH